MTFYWPKDSQDPDLVEVYAPFCGPESSEQFPPLPHVSLWLLQTVETTLQCV